MIKMLLEDMEAHKNALEIIKIIYALDFPKDEQFMLKSQMVRASHSILLNICEAYAFDGRKRTNYYRIALGSAYETKACCLVYSERTGISVNELYDKIDKECGLLVGMIRHSVSASDSVSVPIQRR